MRQTSFREFHCSLARALDVVGDWWAPLIVRDLFIGLSRFDELVEDLGISRNLLTDRLKTLVDGGIVETTRYSDHVRRVDYSLTKSGRELATIFMALTAWGDRWQTPPDGPPIRFRHRDHRCQPTVSCSTCGEKIDGGDVSFRPGPGGRVAPGTQLVGARITKPSATASRHTEP
jgi:DNA-binding HxlR family transcriptional regulator